MNFGDLIPNPLKNIQGMTNALFEKRTDQPWLQGVARNVGHASFGDAIGDQVDTKLLGDAPGGYRHGQPVGVGAPQVGAPTPLDVTQQQQPQQQGTAAPGQPSMVDFAAIMQNLIKNQASQKQF